MYLVVYEYPWGQFNTIVALTEKSACDTLEEVKREGAFSGSIAEWVWYRDVAFFTTD